MKILHSCIDVINLNIVINTGGVEYLKNEAKFK